MRKEFKSYKTSGLVQQHGRRFIVLEHQYVYAPSLKINATKM